MDDYYVSYSSHLNRFLVLNKRTNETHSFWKDRRRANDMVKDLIGMKKHFETNNKLQSLGMSDITKKTKNVIMLDKNHKE